MIREQAIGIKLNTGYFLIYQKLEGKVIGQLPVNSESDNRNKNVKD